MAPGTASPTAALPAAHPLSSGATSDAPLIAAARGRRPSRRPVWFMRQAGRSLPEYRRARAGGDMLAACLDSELAAEITLQPVRRHGVDAAILFSDIVVPLLLAGVDVRIEPGVGPVFPAPVRTAADVEALPALDTDAARARFEDAAAPVARAVALVVAELGATPLIGFAGAPFTLAAYMVEGRASRDHLAAREMMHAQPEVWERLTAWAADASGLFLRAQALAGASALQLFDSWAGSLGAADYARGCAPASARALSHVRDLPQPVIHFGTQAGHLLREMREVGADVVGVDHRQGLDEANAILGGTTPLQGNIDPAMLAAPWDSLEAHVLDVMRRGGAAPGHIVNLGHGVPPHADPDVLTRIVDLVHSRG